MVWRGLFVDGTAEIGDGVEGYFNLLAVGSPGLIPTINDVSTSTQVSFRSPTYLGRITFFGEGLQTGTTTLNNGTIFPIMTAGTITGIEYLYNHVQARARDEGIFDPALYLPSLLVPNAVFQVPNVSATALTAAIVESYNTGSATPFINFLSADQQIWIGNEKVNILVANNNNDLLIGNGGNDALQGGGGNDTLDGGAGSDVLDGGEGADLYLPGPGDASLPVGDGITDTGTDPNEIDTVSYINAPGPVGVDLNLLDGDQSFGWAAKAQIAQVERVVGSNFNDVLIGSSQSLRDMPNDTLEGGLGDDQLFGGDGSDLLQGGPGFDTLVGGGNNGFSWQGPGDRARFFANEADIDVYFGNGAVFVAAPGGGVDTLVEVEFLHLNDGIFPIGNFSASTKQLLIGEAGNDLRTGGAGADLLFGRGGNDTLNAQGGADSLDGGDGNDSLSGAGGNDTLLGGLGDDTMRGGDQSDLAVIRDASANARISEAVGGLLVASADGLDFISADVERISFNDTSFTFSQLSARIGIIGTNAGEGVEGTNGSERISGLGGADWITPGAGSDTIDGGDGRDMVSFVNLADSPGRTNLDYRLDLDLGAGRATTFGADTYTLSNVERVTGTIFADRLRGDDNDNELRGLGDYDWIVATNGDDLYDGGNGLDMVSYVEWQSGAISDATVFDGNGAPPTGGNVTGVRVDLSNTANNTNLAQGHSYVSIERITGSSREDVLIGDGNQNDFRGLGGFDWFVGSTGGRERYFGGDGVDTVTYYNSTSGVAASLRNGARVGGEETGRGTAGDAARDLYFEIENLVGTNFGDSLAGNQGRNNLVGLGGDDFLFGFGGTDTFKGGAGNDVIDGGGASDYALYDGNRAAFTLTKTGSNTVTVSGPGAGSDSLIDVEYFRFDDMDVTIWEL